MTLISDGGRRIERFGNRVCMAAGGPEGDCSEPAVCGRARRETDCERGDMGHGTRGTSDRQLMVALGPCSSSFSSLSLLSSIGVRLLDVARRKSSTERRRKVDVGEEKDEDVFSGCCCCCCCCCCCSSSSSCSARLVLLSVQNRDDASLVVGLIWIKLGLAVGSM